MREDNAMRMGVVSHTETFPSLAITLEEGGSEMARTFALCNAFITYRFNVEA
jgi:hypothetical protein